MSRYVSEGNLFDNSDEAINLTTKIDDRFLFDSKCKINKTGITYTINKSLNKYDFYDSLLELLFEDYKKRSKKKEVKRNAKKLELEEKNYIRNLRYLTIMNIKYFIDEDYITFDMALKIAKEELFGALPKKYDASDFVVDLNDEEELQGLKNKYRKVIAKDGIKYTKEEKRRLKFEKERVSTLYHDRLMEMAALANYRNKLNEEEGKLR